MYRIENATTYLDLDDYMVSFEAGLPSGSYKLVDTLANNSIVLGTGLIAGRRVKFSRIFTRAKESDRQLFMEWFNKPPYEEIYLRRNSTYFNGIMRVYPVMSGGESFGTRNFNFGKDVGFEMFAPDPYFESTSITTTSAALTSSTQHTVSATINGAKNFCTFGLTSTDALTTFEVLTGQGFGFRVDYPLTAGSSISVSTTGSDISATVDGGELYGYFSSGSKPFELQSSANSLYVRGAAGTLLINYYERQL